MNSTTSFDSDTEHRKSHRIVMSDSNYFEAVVTPDSTTSQGRKTSAVELSTIGGPSLRYDREDVPPPPPRFSHSRNLSDSSPRKLVVDSRPQPHPLMAQPVKHRRSHRRSFSHGTNQMEEKKIDHVGHKRDDSNGSNAEDMFTFGISAYANFT